MILYLFLLLLLTFLNNNQKDGSWNACLNKASEIVIKKLKSQYTCFLRSIHTQKCAIMYRRYTFYMHIALPYLQGSFVHEQILVRFCAYFKATRNPAHFSVFCQLSISWVSLSPNQFLNGLYDFSTMVSHSQ